ncbi:MAG: hypothetical protein H0T78_08035 [Longispora sp.]|nr:hypothetical protein [Longispora sp. (in: high G+C Gram-positive bacteria)]
MEMELTARAEALFASSLQPSAHATPEQVEAAITASLAAHQGQNGCVAILAAEYGKDPQVAAHRMHWALTECRATGRSAQ